MFFFRCVRWFQRREGSNYFCRVLCFLPHEKAAARYGAPCSAAAAAAPTVATCASPPDEAPPTAFSPLVKNKTKRNNQKLLDSRSKLR